MMTVYRNEGGKSGVAGYELGEDSITILFTSGTRYHYTVESCGRESIDAMKKLAEAGRGLNSFIGRQVRDKYASRSED
jgi:hypothetical protein